MATTVETETNAFNPAKPFNPKTVSHKFITFTAAAKRQNRLILQQNYDVEEECAICLMSMLDKPVIYTPCKHRFHSRCMFTMLGGLHVSGHNCPLCRCDLTSAIMKLYGEDIRLVLLFAFIAVPAPPVAQAPAAQSVGAQAPGVAQVDEIISLFDSISEEEYDEDEEYDEEDDEDDNEAELGDAWGTLF